MRIRTAIVKCLRDLSHDFIRRPIVHAKALQQRDVVMEVPFGTFCLLPGLDKVSRHATVIVLMDGEWELKRETHSRFSVCIYAPGFTDLSISSSPHYWERKSEDWAVSLVFNFDYRDKKRKGNRIQGVYP